MRNAEEVLREYVEFEDVNGSESVNLLPLTIVDAMEEYAQQQVNLLYSHLKVSLLEDYKRRLKTDMSEIEKANDDITLIRLTAKASCYRTFIIELERTIAKNTLS